MIHVLLTSELPWQHNDAIFYLPLYFSVLGDFFRNRLGEVVPPLVTSVVAKFEQILWERFGSILKQSCKGPKNSKETCYRHN